MDTRDLLFFYISTGIIISLAVMYSNKKKNKHVRSIVLLVIGALWPIAVIRMLYTNHKIKKH